MVAPFMGPPLSECSRTWPGGVLGVVIALPTGLYASVALVFMLSALLLSGA